MVFFIKLNYYVKLEFFLEVSCFNDMKFYSEVFGIYVVWLREMIEK